MFRIHGFTPNGATTPGTCHNCGSAVAMQHGRYPGELYQRHYFECDGCKQRHWLCPLYDCAHCRGGEDGPTIYLLDVANDCIFMHTGGPVDLPKMKLARVERRAVQLSIF